MAYKTVYFIGTGADDWENKHFFWDSCAAYPIVNQDIDQLRPFGAPTKDSNARSGPQRDHELFHVYGTNYFTLMKEHDVPHQVNAQRRAKQLTFYQRATFIPNGSISPATSSSSASATPSSSTTSSQAAAQRGE